MSDQTEQLVELANRVGRSTIAVVDAITQRGGFKGEELSTIGQLRDQCVQAVSLLNYSTRRCTQRRRRRMITGLRPHPLIERLHNE